MTVVRFPFKVSRRALARKPRRSKNGTPEERAAKAFRSAPIVKLPNLVNAEQDGLDKALMIERAEKIVQVLRNCRVRDGWKLDEKRAAQFLQSMVDLDWEGVPSDEFLGWVSDHGQSLDWIILGDPSLMIVRAAAAGPTRPKPDRPRLVAVTQDDAPPPPSEPRGCSHDHNQFGR
jgi:hypothetical protein